MRLRCNESTSLKCVPDIVDVVDIVDITLSLSNTCKTRPAVGLLALCTDDDLTDGTRADAALAVLFMFTEQLR